jgi:ABC-type lipoprotein export system ATPase subunit/bifunctional DNA-binding transcriptional regulator/antitoxin component of YhaV-PrlF toxin-antitoxin module
MSQNGTPPLIVCENLVKIYKVADLEVVALQGLDIIVQRGEMLGIVGSSGSGKSTLMNTLGGLDRPSAGRVSVDGIDLLTLSEAELNAYQRSKVGFVWQQTSRNLIPYLTAQENIELPMTMAWITNRRAKREWSDELLTAVGLYERRHHKLTQLSGGEQQRVAIAVSLANKPVLLLGDEPTGEVDSVTAQSIMDTFRNLRDRLDLTIIIVTHDPRIAEQVDRVVAIRDGKISTETIRQVSQLEQAMAGPHLPVDIGGEASPNQQTLSEAAQLGEGEKIEPAREHITLQEFVVLDSAGRLQIPKELRDELGIGKRAQLEMGDNCIIIRPVLGQGEDGPKKLTLEEQIAMLFDEQEQAQQAAPPEAPKRGGLFKLKRRK